jgi:hypothetical protein
VEANTSTIVDVIVAIAVAPIMGQRSDADGDDNDDDQADGEERVAAAYESMVWRDSADDGVDGGMIDVDGPGGGSLDALATVEDSAELLRGVLRLYREAVIAWCTGDAADGTAADREELDAVAGWGQTVRRLRRTLVRAATLVALRDQEPPPGMSPTEFDRLRWQRDAAAERLVDAAVQAGETLWILSARLRLGTPGTEVAAPGSIGGMIAAFLRSDPADAGPSPHDRGLDRLDGQHRRAVVTLRADGRRASHGSE